MSTHLISRAGLTTTTTSHDAEIGPAEWVSLGAMRFSGVGGAWPISSQGVSTGRDCFKMLQSDASCVATEVVDVGATGERTVGCLPYDRVGVVLPLSAPVFEAEPLELTVALSVYSSGPDQAFTFSCCEEELVLETDAPGNSRASHCEGL